MKTLYLFIFSLILLQPMAVLTAAPASKDVTAALRMIQHADGVKRQVGYRSFHHMGAEAMESYQKALEAAQTYHLKALHREMKSRHSLAEHAERAGELTSERERVMQMIMVDYHKNKGEIDKVKRAWEGVEKRYEATVKAAAGDSQQLERRVEGRIDALAEIAWELNRLEARDQPGWTTKSAPDLIDLRKEAVEDDFELEQWQEWLDSREQTRATLKDFEAVRAHNASCRWAKAAEKEFAEILSHARVVMGLQGLRLDQQLSVASAGHSADMQRLNFFAHESPVPGKKSPADRAKRAKFKGGFRGENIAMGYAGAEGNYWAWFYSDGHRFNLFRKGPNTLGVGFSGRYWTMMTGSKSW